MAAPADKRVFELQARIESGQALRVMAISADSTVLDLYLALLGAFDWPGDYDWAEVGYRMTIGGRSFEQGKGSRSPLRRLLEIGTGVACVAPGMQITAEVTKMYEVSSRRHYPKVLDAGGRARDAQIATWHAQSAMRREFRGQAALRADWRHADD